MPPANDDLGLAGSGLGNINVNPAEVTIGIFCAGKGFRLGAGGSHTAKSVQPGLAPINGNIDIENSLAVVVENRGAVKVEPDLILRIGEIDLRTPDIVGHSTSGCIRGGVALVGIRNQENPCAGGSIFSRRAGPASRVQDRPEGRGFERVADLDYPPAFELELDIVKVELEIILKVNIRCERDSSEGEQQGKREDQIAGISYRAHWFKISARFFEGLRPLPPGAG